MRKWMRAAIVALALLTEGFGQSAGQPNEGPTLTQDPTSGAFTLSWWATAGTTYFIQESSDLVNWTFMPLMETASPDQVISWGFSSSAPQLFFRLQSTNVSFANWEASMGLDPTLWDDPSTLAPNAIGMSPLACYQQGINPLDWYSGQTVTLTVLSGDQQSGPPGSFLPAPIVLSAQYSDGGACINAPIIFTADPGLGGFATAGDGSQQPVSMLTAWTGSTGTVQVYFKPSASIKGLGYANAGANQASFSLTGYDPNSAPCVAPILQVSRVSATESDLTWTTTGSNGTATRLQRWTFATGWVTIATLSAGITSYNDTSVPQGVMVAYQVITINGQGSSPPSMILEADGSDPNNDDSNGDGMTDAQKMAAGVNPDVPNNGNTIDPNDPDLTQPRVPNTTYAVLDLTGQGFVNPSALNQSLQIVDNPNSVSGGSVSASRIWSTGQWQAIQNPSDGQSAYWYGLSDEGTTITGDVPNQGYVATWNNTNGAGTLSYDEGIPDTFDPNVQYFVYGNSINSKGIVVGAVYENGADSLTGDEATYYQGVLWDTRFGNAPRGVPLGDLITQFSSGASSGDISFWPLGVNNSGLVVGQVSYVNAGSGNLPAVIDDTGDVDELPFNGQLVSTTPFQVNSIASPIIIGYEPQPPGSQYGNAPVMWVSAAGGWKEKYLGPWDTAQGARSKIYGSVWQINDRCEMLGDFCDVHGNSIGYFWQNAQFVNLETKISAGGYTDFYPIAINNDGAILSWATRTADDNTNALVLLIPVSFALLNGDATGTDGKDVFGNRPTARNWSAPGDDLKDDDLDNLLLLDPSNPVAAIITPYGPIPANSAFGGFGDSITMEALVPNCSNLKYEWNRSYHDLSVTIEYSSFLGWQPRWNVASVNGTGINSAGEPQIPTQENDDMKGIFQQNIPSGLSLLYAEDFPGMKLSNFSGCNIGDYAYEETDFTYGIKVTLGPASATCTIHVGQILKARRSSKTSGNPLGDWTILESQISTTDIPPCQITAPDTRNIVGGSVPITPIPENVNNNSFIGN